MEQTDIKLLLIQQQLSTLQLGMDTLLRSMNIMSAAVERIAAAVAAQKTVNDSILQLVQGLADQLREMAASDTADAAALTALADSLEAEQARLSDAVHENTPQAPEAPVEETPVEETPAEETPVEETPVEETPAEPTSDGEPTTGGEPTA